MPHRLQNWTRNSAGTQLYAILANTQDAENLKASYREDGSPFLRWVAEIPLRNWGLAGALAVAADVPGNPPCRVAPRGNVSEVLKAHYGNDNYMLPGSLQEFVEMAEIKKKIEGVNYVSEQ